MITHKLFKTGNMPLGKQKLTDPAFPTDELLQKQDQSIHIKA